MPGANCAIVGCPACKGRHKQLSFHCIPKEGKNREWRSQLLAKIGRTEKKFNPERATVCSRHFKDSCFDVGPNGKRTLRPGSLPTEEMPEKSVVTPKPKERKPPLQRTPPPVPVRVAYWNLEDLRKDLRKVDQPWTVLDPGTPVQIGIVETLTVTRYVAISDNLTVNVMLHSVPLDERLSVKHQKLSSVLHYVIGLKPCDGVSAEELQSLAPLPSDSMGLYYRHVTCSYSDSCMVHSSTVRSKSCLGQANHGSTCKNCSKVENLLRRRLLRARKSVNLPVNSKTPLQTVANKRLVKAFKIKRKAVLRLEHEKAAILSKIKTESIPVSDSLHGSLKSIIENEEITDSFLKLFWSEQEKAFSRQKGGMRWHPMLVRFAILIHSQSASVYNTLRETGALRLPGESTLRDYTNAVHPKQGFNKDVIEDIQKATATFKDHQRWVVLLQDEMSIKSDLVHDQATGEVIGFLDSSSWDSDNPTEKDLASHVLVFMVVGINTNLKMTLGYFPTRSATADHLYPLFWKAVGILEIQCGLKVIAATCDKASQNQKFIRMHKTGGLCYKTVNYFADDREIFFISDAPHLLKTVRNNMWSSKTGGTRYLWNNGSDILWDHIRNLYKEDADHELFQTKLREEHVSLTPHSIMRVNLAAQVLSKSVGSILRAYGGLEVQETATFILLMDRFFDCMNVRAQTEGDHKLKPDLMPYRSDNDLRFQFLEDEFLGYLEKWRAAVMNRQGFSKAAKNKMFLSHQTYEGLQVTVKSVIEVTRYLLAHGVEYVLTHVFCQDPLEEHFSRHRALGRRSDNPTLWGFGYQEKKLGLQRTLAMKLKPRGNIRGKRVALPIVVTNSPMKKRRH